MKKTKSSKKIVLKITMSMTTNLKPGLSPHGLDRSDSQSDAHFSCYNGSNSAFPTFRLMDSGAADAPDLLQTQPVVPKDQTSPRGCRL